MLKLTELFEILNDCAPISLSQACIDGGDYDNSGILINCHDQVKKALFSLDLSLQAVAKAVAGGYDTIITHHPAIYNPIKNLNVLGDTASVCLAVKNDINVISMHLNLDVCKEGIDYYLAKAFGGESQVILSKLSESEGYGREFTVNATLEEIFSKAKAIFGTEKAIFYGDKNAKITKIASFCGAGGGYIAKMLSNGEISANLIISSDLPHHLIKEIIEKGKSLIIIPHYSAENYGFNKYYELINSRVCDKIETEHFIDYRFM